MKQKRDIKPGVHHARVILDASICAISAELEEPVESAERVEAVYWLLRQAGVTSEEVVLMHNLKHINRRG